MSLPIAIHGAAGRMGQRMIALGHDDADLTIAAAIESPDHPRIGDDAGDVAGVGQTGCALTGDLPAGIAAVIGFRCLVRR